MGLGKEYYESQIRVLKEDLEREKREEANDKMANEILEIYDSFIRAGFTKEQAWEIFMTLLKKN